MNKTILAAKALLLLLLMPNQAASSETDPAKLLASFNSKTAKIETEWINENKVKAITTKEVEENSYVFSLDRKLLKITFKEEVKTLENGIHTETYTIVGRSSIDTGQIDRERTGLNSGYASIVCQEKKRCIKTEERSIEYQAKDDKTIEKNRKSQAGEFYIRGADHSLANQIGKDLKELIALLVPAKPEEKTETAPGAKSSAKP